MDEGVAHDLCRTPYRSSMKNAKDVRLRKTAHVLFFGWVNQMTDVRKEKMIKNETVTSLLFSEHQLAELLDALDMIHSQVSEDRVHGMAFANRRECVALLKEIIYTAQETIREIDQPAFYAGYGLRVMEQPTA
jgi:hypothetical protein